jgi:stage V sporulation protein B
MTKNKSNLIKGTMVLTIAGLVTRIIGFFYRIFLSNLMGAEIMGIYQLVFPVFTISFTIFASGIQTAISTLVANEVGKNQYKNVQKILQVGMVLSAGLALTLAVITYYYSSFIATKILNEPSCISSIKMLSYAFPFCAVTSSINGYYYGLKKAGVPATTQLIEQIVRVIIVYVIAAYAGNGDVKLTSELAVFGVVLGEFISQLYNIASLYFSPSSREISQKAKLHEKYFDGNKTILNRIFKLSLPLTANRLLVNILHSAEAIMIPTLLKKFGLNSSEAMSVYGVLMGMTMPFIMFPSAITNSLSVLLLPTISEAQSSNNLEMIRKTSAVSIKYSVLIGILSAGIFITFGRELGVLIFKSELSGSLLMTLAWLCPFLYLTTTLNSIINGLGLAHLTFVNSIISLSLRIVLMLYLMPKQGMTGYLISMLISQLTHTFLDGFIIVKNIKPPFEAADILLKPGLIVALSGYLLYHFYEYISPAHSGLFIIMGLCAVLCVLFTLLMGITKAVSLKDFK